MSDFQGGEQTVTMSIGAVSRATGIPTNTLRTWERRYGFPDPIRSDSGQRLYRTRDVARLGLIARALGAGHRPRQVVPLPVEQLRALVVDVPSARPQAADEVITGWVVAARQLDGAALSSGFRQECSLTGLVAFVKTRVAPFLQAIGEAWAAGELQAFHEHFASERLREFLVASWRPMSRDNMGGPTVVCGTLPGEHHFLGLHMVAALLATRGCHILFTGTDTPLADLVGAAQQSDAVAVMIGVSALADPRTAAASLGQLRRMLPTGLELVVGGAGAVDVDGALRIQSLDDVEQWVQGRASRRLI